MSYKTLAACAVIASSAFVAGLYSKVNLFTPWQPSEVPDDADIAAPLYWVAPMDATYRRDKPGKSPMGMDLVPVYPDASQNKALSGVRISAEVEHNLGLRTAEVVGDIIELPIEAVGFVQFDEDRLHHIHVRAEGWIEKLYVSTQGDRVQANQKLFDFFSPELINAQEDYLSLLQSFNGDSNHSLVIAAKRRLQALGISLQQIERLLKTKKVEQYVSYYAHSDGFVSALHVRHGMFVVPDSEIMGVGNIDSVWVIAEVFERQMARLKKGQAVTLKVNARPGELWRGQIDYLYPVLDATTRTAKVRVVIDNIDARLQPNMFAALTISAPVVSQLPHIPRQALIRGGRGDRVVVALGDGRFQSRVVSVGAELGLRVQIASGLNIGERVVVSGQFLIDSESNLDAEIMRLNQGVLSQGEPENRRATDDLAPASLVPHAMDHSMHKGMSHD